MAFELFDLTGKRALVTGSSQGIGFAVAQGLAEHGAEVVLNARDEAKLNAAADTSNNCRNFQRPTTRLRPIPATDFNHPKHSSTFFRQR